MTAQYGERSPLPSSSTSNVPAGTALVGNSASIVIAPVGTACGNSKTRPSAAVSRSTHWLLWKGLRSPPIFNATKRTFATGVLLLSKISGGLRMRLYRSAPHQRSQKICASVVRTFLRLRGRWATAGGGGSAGGGGGGDTGGAGGSTTTGSGSAATASATSASASASARRAAAAVARARVFSSPMIQSFSCGASRRALRSAALAPVVRGHRRGSTSALRRPLPPSRVRARACGTWTP